MSIALVTGASTGIGLATAVTLARAGHTLYAGMRNPDAADAEPEGAGRNGGATRRRRRRVGGGGMQPADRRAGE